VGIQVHAGTKGICTVDERPVNLASAMQVSIDTAVQACEVREVI
jgi:hypothetical protein